MFSSSVCSLSSTKLYKHFLAMREEVLRHKWFESEKAGRDVGFEFALLDWNIRFKSSWDKNKPKDLS